MPIIPPVSTPLDDDVTLPVVREILGRLDITNAISVPPFNLAQKALMEVFLLEALQRGARIARGGKAQGPTFAPLDEVVTEIMGILAEDLGEDNALAGRQPECVRTALRLMSCRTQQAFIHAMQSVANREDN